MKHRILYFLDLLPNLGGGETQYAALLKHLDTDRFEPHFWFNRRGDLVEKAQLSHFKYQVKWLSNANYFEPRNPIRGLARYLSFRRSLSALKRYITREKIDLVHGDSHRADYLARLEVPTVCHVRSELYADKIPLDCFDRIDRIVSISERLKAPLVQGGVGQDKIEKINDGIDTEVFRPQDTKALVFGDKLVPSKTIFVGLVGRVVMFKRHLEFLQIVYRLKERISNVHFFIIGALQDQNYGTELQRYIRERDLSKWVTLTGEMERMDMVLNALDIVVTLAGGSVILEAMACEKPVVNANRPSPPGEDIVINGETGFKLGFNDFEGLQNRIEQLISSETQRKEFGKRARERVLEKFDIRQTTKETEALYLQLLTRT